MIFMIFKITPKACVNAFASVRSGSAFLKIPVILSILLILSKTADASAN